MYTGFDLLVIFFAGTCFGVAVAMLVPVLRDKVRERPGHNKRKIVLLPVLLILLASPALAQTGDCLAESGTSTTWAWGQVQPTFGQVVYTFYAAGLLGKTTNTRSINFPTGTDLVVLADSQCESVDSSRAADERSAGLRLVFNNPDAELVQPAFPEVCPVAPAVPNNPSLTVAQQCRLAGFHQYAVRISWPEDARGLRDQFWDIWDWVDATGPGSPGFNTGEKQDWLDITANQWTQQVNARMNNMRAFVTSFDQDNQWRGDLDDTPLQ